MQLKPALILACAAVFCAHAADPRSAATDYPAHAEWAGGSIGAEYLVHSVPTEQSMLFADNYLVIEVGVFPKNKQETPIPGITFHLMVNGKLRIDADAPGMVAGSMSFSGLPGQNGHFPNDPTVQQPLPRPPNPGAGTNSEPTEPLTVDDLLKHAALPATAAKPAGGLLFFPFEGKTKKIRTLELVWEPPNAEPVTLKLR